MNREEPKTKKAHKRPTEKGDAQHKKNWREEYASVTDIETFLSDRIMLRYNVVTRRVEYRLVERSVWDAKHGQVHGSRQWENISDRIVNSLWTELSATKPVRAPDIYRVIESDFVPEYDPFRFYLEQLPPWKEEQGDAIMELSLSVNIRGDADERSSANRDHIRLPGSPTYCHQRSEAISIPRPIAVWCRRTTCWCCRSTDWCAGRNSIPCNRRN